MNSAKRMVFIRMALAVIIFLCVGYMAWKLLPPFDFKVIMAFFALYLGWSLVETAIYQPPDSAAIDDDDRRSYLYMQLTSLILLFWALLDFVTFHFTRWFRLEPAVILVGFVLFIISLVVRYRTIKSLGKYYNPRVAVYEDHQVISTGAYQRIRHPFYLSAFLSAVAMAMIFNSWGALLIAVLAVLPALVYRIRLEEEFLCNHFDQKYSDYMAKTKRLIPGIW
ncbi:MAG TPA: isoprenylcysteine carboxylmethyltransferase family protein [Syntrophomonadaceae bacterium]|nr:isoprenylcysteine carboxylmethyltransferase family protein [Syntrophomonadaceae bacterium]